METQRRTFGRPYVTRLAAGMVIGLGTVGGLFAVASAAASSLTVSFASAESDSHRRNAAFEAAHGGAATPHPLQARTTRQTGEWK